MSRETEDPRTGQKTPWWRIRMVWLVIGGPLVVVVASFVTLFLAVRNPDPVLESAPAAAHAGASDGAGGAYLPAVQGRNHAATAGQTDNAAEKKVPDAK